MARTLASGWFLGWTAVCCGLTVAFASWIANDASTVVFALCALVGLGVGLTLMLLIAWALSPSPEPTPPALRPEAEPPHPTAPAVPPSPTAAGLDLLTMHLEDGNALRDGLEPGASDDRVEAWIDRVRREIAQHKPGVTGYFAALAARSYRDDKERLDAHLARLTTIVRDFL